MPTSKKTQAIKQRDISTSERVPACACEGELRVRAKAVWRTPLWKLFSLGLVVVLAAIPTAAAADLKGRTVNETTRRSVEGDEVILLTLSQEGMSETARTLTDARGRFTVHVDDPLKTHVVRVVHQGVPYHQIVEPGSSLVAVAIYDVADQVDRVKAVMDVERFEATNNTLEVKQLITMRNDSRPPRTLMNERPFEIQLPPNAQVQSGLVQVEEGQPLKQKPIAGDRKGQYYFAFPIRPGDTRFAIVYRVPYNGTALVEPKLRNPLEKFVLMLPKTIRFEPNASGAFHTLENTTPDNVQGTGVVTSEKSLAFRIWGTGMLEELKGRRREEEAQSTKTKSAAAESSPGGGLGPPIEAPDPLQKYRWLILAGLLGLTVLGAMHVSRKAKGVRVAVSPSPLRPVRSGGQKQSRAKARRRERQSVQA